MDVILRAALHALRSYQYGNVSPELAEMVADKIEASLSVAESAILLLEQTIATRPEYKARGIEDYHRAWKIIEAWRGKGDDSKDLLDALEEAKAALVGESNDAEHDALVSFVQAMGLEIPDCTCDGRRADHLPSCPQRAWQKEDK